jgi:hypothetical protein
MEPCHSKFLNLKGFEFGAIDQHAAERQPPNRQCAIANASTATAPIAVAIVATPWKPRDFELREILHTSTSLGAARFGTTVFLITTFAICGSPS